MNINETGQIQAVLTNVATVYSGWLPRPLANWIQVRQSRMYLFSHCYRGYPAIQEVADNFGLSRGAFWDLFANTFSTGWLGPLRRPLPSLQSQVQRWHRQRHEGLRGEPEQDKQVELAVHQLLHSIL
jgi:AraC-like DNA-binding protein